MKKHYRLFNARLNAVEQTLSDLKNANLAALRLAGRYDNRLKCLNSFAQLGRFLECDPKTAATLLREGYIRHTVTCGGISVFVPDILEAALKHERVGRFLARAFLRKRVPPAPEKPQQPPRIYVETELYPGRFVLATIRYQGWRCPACMPAHLWHDTEKMTDFVNQVILNRHERVPFRIPPQC
jgi:hypothetical protein